MDVAIKFLIYAPPILLAITLHEVAHGWVALYFGDPTAYEQGRLSVNPFRHVDLVGTVLVPAVLYIFGGFLFGWAKPVPVDFDRLRRPKRDMAWVAAAGPAANLLMALFWGLVLKWVVEQTPTDAAVTSVGQAIRDMCAIGILINFALMVVNLIPLPPLDGGRVLAGLVSDRWSRALTRMEPYGLVLILFIAGIEILKFKGLIANNPFPLFDMVLSLRDWFTRVLLEFFQHF